MAERSPQTGPGLRSETLAGVLAVGPLPLAAGLRCAGEIADELRAALVRLLGSADLRKVLGLAGRDRARGFRWEVCAAKSLEFFREVVGE